MLTEKHLNRYADVLIWGLKTARSSAFKKGDIIILRYHAAALRLAEILHERILQWGMNPVVFMTPTAVMETNHFQLSNSRQLVFRQPGEQELYRKANGSIHLFAPDSITHLSTVDPKKIGRFAVSRKPLRDILDNREAKGHFGWTLCMLATKELAKQAGLTIESYTDQIVKACWLHRQNPVVHWQDIYKKARKLKKWLDSLSVSHYHIESKNVDLEITPGNQRRWVGLSGHNIPSFELFISPDWRGCRGVFFANLPSYRNGNLVSNVRLEFQKGSAVQIDAEKGQAFTRQQLIMDKGANKIGEFSLTDKRFSKIDRFMANTLFDENFGGSQGNCHIAVGSSYADSYSGNPADLTQKLKQKLGFNTSALHWDLVNTEKKRVAAHLSTGKRVTIYENGSFCY
ncbi:MAG: aminopeptidase [Desulfobacteraceae bacterium]|nr:aminopeptidase [Desulfobacteraceae bacterium]